MSKFKNKDLKEILKGGAISLVIKVLGVIFTFFFTYFTTKFHGVALWGKFSFSVTLIQIICVFVLFGLEISVLVLVHKKEEFDIKSQKELLNTLYTIPFLLILPIALVVYFNADWIGQHVFMRDNYGAYLRFVSIGAPMILFIRLTGAVLRAHNKTLWFTLFSNNLMYFIAVIFVLFWLVEVEVHFLQMFLICISLVAVVAVIVLFKEERQFLFRPSFKNIKKITSFSLPMLFTSSNFLFLRWASFIILGFFVIDEKLGLFNISINICNISTVGFFAINSISIPKIAKHHSENDLKRMNYSIRTSTQLIAFLNVPALLIVLVFAEFIIAQFTPEYVSEANVLRLLVGAQLINAITGPNGAILNMTGYQKYMQNILISTLLISVVLNLLLIPFYGLYGAAIATIIATSFRNGIAVYIVYKKHNVITIFNPLKLGL